MNRKKIFTDYLFNLARVLLNIAIPVVTLPYVIARIGSDGYGIFSYANSIVAFFTLIAGLGIKEHASRTIASQKSSEERYKTASELWIIQFLSTTAALVLFFIYIVFFSREEYKGIYTVFSFLILGSYLNTEWYYIGTLQFKYIAVRTMIVKVLNVAAIFLLIKSPSDYILYALIISLTSVLNNFVSFILLIPKISFKYISIKKHLKPCITLFSLSIVGVINGNIDKALLGSLLNPIYVGYYAVSFRLTRILQQIFIAMSDVLSPNISQNLDSEKKQISIINMNMDFIFMIFPPAIVGIILYRNDILLALFDPEMLQTALVLCILSFTIPVIAMINVVRRQIMLPHKRDRIMIFMNIMSMMINIILNLILIPKYKHTGAAVTTLIAESSTLLFAIIYAKKEFKVTLFKAHHIKYIMLSLTIIPVYLIRNHSYKDHYSLLILTVSIVISVLIYLAALIISKDKYINFIIKKI